MRRTAYYCARHSDPPCTRQSRVAANSDRQRAKVVSKKSVIDRATIAVALEPTKVKKCTSHYADVTHISLCDLVHFFFSRFSAQRINVYTLYNEY